MAYDPEEMRRGVLWNRRFLANVVTVIAAITVTGGIVFLLAGMSETDGKLNTATFLAVGFGIIASAFPLFGIASCIRQSVENAEALHRIEIKIADHRDNSTASSSQ